MFINLYKLIFDADKNPFWKLPATVRFQVMIILSFMWSVIFSVGIGTWSYFGYSVLVHIPIVLGVVFTSWIFQKGQTKSPRDLIKRKDSTVMYDDVWGG